jgi:hypothetical protein
MVKIFVVAHKPFGMPEEEALVPIHVGRAVSRLKDEMACMIGDDTGENISEKNSSYCEMTAHYWIWKNVHDTEYVGVCHYRRFFAIDLSENNIKDVMADADVLMVEPSWHIDSVYSYFAKFMGAENMTILSMVVKKHFPEYFNTLEKICDGIKFHPFNMLLCWKGLFDDYCLWMFTILGECEKYVKPAPYTNARRALAYMAELLTGVYFIHRQLRIKTVPYYKIEDGQKILVTDTEEDKRNMALYESLLQNELSEKVMADRKERFDNPTILLGLKDDRIMIK